MDSNLYIYLEKRWMFSNHKKHHKYFKLWVKNLTNNQICYFKKDMIKTIKQ